MHFPTQRWPHDVVMQKALRNAVNTMWSSKKRCIVRLCDVVRVRTALQRVKFNRKNDGISYLALMISLSFSMLIFSVSISLFCELAFCMVFVIKSRAALALLCFSASLVSCSAASFFKLATTDFASVNLDKPAYEIYM